MKILVLCLFCVFANAHSLKVFAKEENGVVNLKSFFYGNSPCKECEVSLIKNGEIIQTLKTDENGKASFKAISSEFEIQVNGGLGHEKKINFMSKTADKASNLEVKNDILQNSQNANENLSNSANFDEKDENKILKFALPFMIIFIFFTTLYFIKRKR
ncbi:MAG: hypothetical protein IKI43_00340 [Campylobacter sp.]|nr:hypothetical protein [Campylobacter sp.]